MANRQPSRKNRTGQPAHQNQLGLKEAYAVLQREFLDLKQAYVENEQQLAETQERYFILQRSYQELQENSRSQQAQLIEKVEKSYDAYNEKFMKVEELEKELSKCKIHIDEISDDQAKTASVQDQINQVTFQRQVFENAVRKSLANVGLSLVGVSDHFEIKILDCSKLIQLVGYQINDDCTKSLAKVERVAELENANALLQQTLLSLKIFSEKQRDELSRTIDILQLRTEECANLKKQIQSKGQSYKGAILIETSALERIVIGLSEMSDFVVELKKTICDQNSWIDMLMGALNEYKNSQSSKNQTAQDVGHATSSKHRHPNTKKRSDTSGSEKNSVNSSISESKTKTKKEKRLGNCSGIASGNINGNPGDRTGHLAVSRSSVVDVDETFKDCDDYVVVSATKCPAFEQSKVAVTNAHRSLSTTLPLRTDTKLPAKVDDKSLRHELYQMSGLSESDRKRAWKRFETDNLASSQGLANGRSRPKQDVDAQDMCPMCNVVFAASCGLEKRRSHINSHFRD